MTNSTRDDQIDLQRLRNSLAAPLTRRQALEVLGAATVTMVAVACAPTSISSDAAPSASGPATDPSAGATVAPPSEDAVLRMVGDQVITNLDPRTSLGPDGVTIRRNVFHTLLEVDSASGTVTPLLASEIPTQDDDLTWTVKIRPDLTWHNTAPVTADDLAYTVDWMLTPENNSIFGSVVLDGVERVEVIDATTVRFHLKRVIGSFLERLAAIAPVPADAAESLGADGFKIAPVGLGPFKFTGFAADDHETIERWDGYTMGPKPSIARAELKRVVEGTARTAALQAGQAEVDLNADPELWDILASSGLQAGATDNDAGYNAILLNNGSKPFNDIRVRQAVAHAIDRQAIVDGVWNGNATPMYGPLPPWYFMADADIPKLEHDPDKSKALLRDAGYPDGVEFELMQGIYSTGLTMAAVLQEQLTQAGFKVILKTGDAEGLYSFVFDTTFQAFSIRGNTSIVGLYPDVMTRWTLQKVFNNAPDAELEPLVQAFVDADAIPATDLDARRQAYATVQQTIAAEQRIIFLCNRKGLAAWTSNVQGITFAPDGVPNALVNTSVA